MKNLNEAIDQVARGKQPEQVLEKAIVCTNYDERLAVNSPTTVQRGNITTNQEGVDEDHGQCHDDPADYGVYPMAGARMWPRGSHESLPQRGEPPYFKTEQMIKAVVAGKSPQQVIEANLHGRAGSHSDSYAWSYEVPTYVWDPEVALKDEGVEFAWFGPESPEPNNLSVALAQYGGAWPKPVKSKADAEALVHKAVAAIEKIDDADKAYEVMEKLGWSMG